MKTQEFIKKAKIGDRVKVGKELFTIQEIVKWRMLRSGGAYHKYTLEDNKGDDGYRLAEDPDSGKYILVHVFEFDHPDSFLPEYKLGGKKFKFSYGEICVAIWQKGEGEHKKGSYDIWWDYEVKDGSYLSLGIALPSGKREDLIGRWVEPEEVVLIKK